MPTPDRLEKARLVKITWDEEGQVVETSDPVPVQFNPETLKVAYANRSAGGDQRGGSAVQFVGSGTTKLSLDLWFDVTAPAPSRPADEADDVRLLTRKVVDFIEPKPTGEEDKFIPPGMRFLWGSFLFEGVLDSINESLEFFSEEGRPLRAKLTLSLTSQRIQFEFNPAFGQAGAGAPASATRPQTPVREGESVQQAAAREGRQDEWQEIANRNDVDNPRNLPAGAPLDMSR